ncbi:dol-P-Man:Man(5)GlcNAc(2)-PP-Dol alpha-1,3-mannosyltransferase-like [Convolutriloba macropyga]|uniref:dol-P-Man:Man(5)GlcNAc(2)-PP-Dol alpha-1,3-mannosyltransferase-like n=1 Tax=Convolutriloba macropyga TaxID=536237 RepID=UPI003F52253C
MPSKVRPPGALSALLHFLKHNFWEVFYLLLTIEIFLSLAVIKYVSYTEIDWQAYMQEVGGFMNGTYNYSQLSGSTGPLVYPSGFVYLFSLLSIVTNYGENIKLAQYIFMLLYLMNVYVVAKLYRRAGMPAFLLITLSCLSYRLHSIFMLRLFNDCFCAFFLYVSIFYLTKHSYILSALVFSLALSVKMNALLFLPGFLVILTCCGGILLCTKFIAIIVISQIIFAGQFLYHAPIDYLGKAFEFNRVFFFKWTVNWRFLGENMFSNPLFHKFLLLSHLVLLFLFAWFKWKPRVLRFLDIITPNFRGLFPAMEPREMISILFECNFIGILCSRTLHYQFYSWYYHTIPFLLYNNARLPYPVVVLMVCLIEYSWNVYPSTNVSSFMLLISHLFILASCWTSRKYLSRSNSRTDLKDR